MNQNFEIYTIGHSTMDLEAFISNLKKFAVSLVLDVRTTPFSKYQPQFNKDLLSRVLSDRGIKYSFAGDALGGRSSRESDYVNNQVVYSRMKLNEKFTTALEEIERMSQEMTISLVCSEKDPIDCHRALLVSQSLVERNLAVSHILADGSAESHNAMISRLLGIWKLDGEDLFLTEEDCVLEAIEKQSKIVAYKRPSLKDAV